MIACFALDPQLGAIEIRLMVGGLERNDSIVVPLRSFEISQEASRRRAVEGEMRLVR